MLNKSHQKGVMLLEALIGVLLFSIGIIAMMGLQANALATAGETKYRSEASFIAEEFISDMRNDNAFAFSIDPNVPLFAAATLANTSPYTLNATTRPTSQTAAPPTAPLASDSVSTKMNYLNSKMAYTTNRFFYSTQRLPGGGSYPPIVRVTACLRAGWTAASLCPAPTTGVLGADLYGAVVEIEMKWKTPTSNPTVDPRRYITAAYVMLENT